jgi:hypothetical protein
MLFEKELAVKQDGSLEISGIKQEYVETGTFKVFFNMQSLECSSPLEITAGTKVEIGVDIVNVFCFFCFCFFVQVNLRKLY